MTDRSTLPRNLAALLIVLLLQLWGAHALVFFTHEYAHALVAWLLGWKTNPLALDYAHPTLSVVLLQFGINQNVDEAPIFASGHGVDAALIAAAGAVVGNGLFALPLSRIAYRAAVARDRYGWALFAYWCTVASVGNFLDYVPIRTFTLDGDMGSIQRGLGWSPWMVLVVLGTPSFIALVWLFVRVVPATLRRLFPQSSSRQALIAILTVGIMFGFYGAVGLLEGGPVAHTLSILTVAIVLPLMMIVEFLSIRRMRSMAAPAAR